MALSNFLANAGTTLRGVANDYAAIRMTIAQAEMAERAGVLPDGTPYMVPSEAAWGAQPSTAAAPTSTVPPLYVAAGVAALVLILAMD